MRRLKNTRKIAIAGVTSAIAFLCVLIGRFSPIGGLALLVVAGTMTLLCTQVCGLGFGILGYVATASLSILALPFGFIYIILCGPLALMRSLLFGRAPRKKSRIMMGYAVIVPFGYGICVGLTYLVGTALHMTDFVTALGGVFVFALLADLVVVAYDVAVAYLAQELAKTRMKPSLRGDKDSRKKNSPPQDPFLPMEASTPSEIVISPPIGTKPAVDTPKEEDGTTVEPPTEGDK